MSDPCLACIMIAPAVEDTLVDWLLNDAPTRGFTCVPAFGHGEDTDRMSTTEKIVGRVKRVQIQILCASRAEATGLIERLATTFPKVAMHYWILAVLEHGHLGHRD
ncbi:MAG: DUF3240 family protein [Gammaproteobacteria bacterium]